MILYRLTYGYSQYLEETIYSKLQEGLWSESLTAELFVIQP